MASRAITYVWKIPRPRDDKLARELMAAAYQAVTAADPNANTVLIRSEIQATTFTNGDRKKDAPHITVCSKNPEQVSQKNHRAAHGYTKSLKDTQVIKVTSSKVVKPDNTKDRRGKEIWPSGLPSEGVVHTGK